MKKLDVHMVNVVGLGAKEFVKGLLNQIELEKDISPQTIYRHSSSKEEYEVQCNHVIFKKYQLGIVSRVVEICLWFLLHKSRNDILVLGDLPLNTKARQYVLCHQALIFHTFSFFDFKYWKFLFFRNIFKIFLKKNDVVLVQSLQMKLKVLKLINYKSRVEVMQLTSNSFMWPDFRRDARGGLKSSQNKIRMIYPAACYHHKNHSFVDYISENENLEIIFTTAPGEIILASPHVRCIGKVSRAEIFEIYKDTDALLFLSSCESLGLPLLEAIKCNIPILCPNLDYSFTFSSENCIFFDLEDPMSIQSSINKLRLRLTSGWWPNWNFDKVFERTDTLKIGDILLDR